MAKKGENGDGEFVFFICQIRHPPIPPPCRVYALVCKLCQLANVIACKCVCSIVCQCICEFVRFSVSAFVCLGLCAFVCECVCVNVVVSRYIVKLLSTLFLFNQYVSCMFH